MSPHRLRAGKAIEDTGQSPFPPDHPGHTIAPSKSVKSAGASPSPSPEERVGEGRPSEPHQPPKIPQILFEGDESAKPAETVPTEKFNLGPTPHVELPASPETKLPEAYGTEKLTLNARDPHSLFAHWDLTKEQQQHYNSLSADGHLTLRAYAQAHSNQPAIEVPVQSESHHQFLSVPRAGASYVGELGYYQPDRTWKTVATSGPTTTPPDAPSQEVDAIFSTPEALRSGQSASSPQPSHPEEERERPSQPAIIPVAAPGWPFEPQEPSTDKQIATTEPGFREARSRSDEPPPFVRRVSAKKWTALQERLLADIIRISLERREWISSAEIAELIRRETRPAHLVSPDIAWPVLPGAFANISSPMGEAQPKGFWFNVNAELIIYGATEPNAQVTVAGSPIQLRPDGTFSFHFALPDGDYNVAATAISPENEQRQAAMSFSRHTKYSG